MKKLLLLLLLGSTAIAQAQRRSHLPADQWVDSVFKSLSKEEKITQLMNIRVSTIGPNRTALFLDKEVEEAVRKYNVGSLCLFQGGPIKQAQTINYYQSVAKTPLLITIDGENGVGMRFDSVMGLPRQMMLGAAHDPALAYQYGQVVAEQCKRIGIQVNYAPVVDINNNPANPVINDRSLGEDKYRVAEYGVQYMKGMQDNGVMACAKHFPGHGDVAVDSHHDLPVINKTRAELDSLELYPFRELIKAGVGSVMVAHLQVNSIDNGVNRPTSISSKAVTNLLKKELGFTGLTFTDALEMKGVAKFYPDGENSLQSLIAGNDMLCLPGNIPGSIEKVLKAIRKKKLNWKDIDARVKKVLYAKYQYGLANLQPIDINNITEDLNSKVPMMRRIIAEKAITLLRNDEYGIFPLTKGKRVAYVGFGLDKDNAFAAEVRKNYDAQVFYFDYNLDSSRVEPMLQLLKNRFDVVVLGLHNYNRFPANNFGVSNAAMNLMKGLQQQHKTITMAFGNPYLIKNFCDAKVLLACYEDDDITQSAGADLLYGKFSAKGQLPVTICDAFKFGDGIVAHKILKEAAPASLGFNQARMTAQIDSIVTDAIAKNAIPGAVVLVAKDGKVVFDRAYGHLTYDSTESMYPETIFDLASITKVMATTISVMKLVDEGKLDINKTLGDYLPWVKGSDKENLKLRDVLLHQAGLKSFIPFYRGTLTGTDGRPNWAYYSMKPDSLHQVRVANGLYLRNDYPDTMYNIIVKSQLEPGNRYIYSDNDFIFLGKIVEAISGMPLDQYVKKTFYDKLNLATTGFKPRDRFPLSYIAPTENEALFRRQLIQGDVHDPGAAMFGGVAGHAGLFSNAYDLAVLAQMLLNGGVIDGKNFFSKATLDEFTAYQSDISRRGLGFDKPEKDNATRKEAYPTLSASPLTFGHTGFTGTCIWMDPKYNLTYIFLSNRVNSTEPNKFGNLSVRPKVHEAIYQALLH
ncbi:glycoside hydrolase family 3 N-terminal domain-containing protein [Pseudobacter ginsenosidimutans]|uniref:beta-N-acetylhexosaminidase n=1 Tax=Pseudobacter ginsenosidimutans TaxID=661488 RepID=A0A4Q7MY58_9BACT|nr:glycoside hydrolase family 3 N-terminal domain-containing protein [Pseudobacter ginsenosidimutans]QEC41088.1 serine hydrolase [Pseudobacter ginsenosidimutans]RZS72153.1 beta-glucosidase-like glycosyl hydrolase [Pseudobacter ginsenosidimutans]